MQFSLYAGLLLISSLTSASLAGYALHRLTDKVMRSFLYLMIGVFFWSFTYLLEATSSSLEFKLLWAIVSVIDQIVPVLFFYFVLQFTRFGSRIPPIALYLLMIVPCISFLLSATFPLHGLVWPEIYLTHTILAGFSLMYIHGVWYWVEIVYNFLLYVTAAGVLLHTVIRSPPVYAVQLWLVFVSSLFPFVASLLYAFASPFFSGIDFTPVSFALTGLVLFYAISRYHLFDLIPIAHEQILIDMEEGVIVIDEQERIVEINPAVERLLPVTPHIVGKHYSTLIPFFPGNVKDIAGYFASGSRLSQVGERWIEFRFYSVNPEQNPAKGKGWLLLCIDVTQREQAKLELCSQNEHLKTMNEDLEHEVSERQRAEDSLRLANKKLGLLASVTRHDILNWVTVVIGYAQILQESCFEKDAEYLRRIAQAGESISEIISFTEVYEDMGSQAPQWILVERTIHEPEIASLLKKISVSLDVPGLLVYADLMFSKVFYNLLDNTIRHSQGATAVRISGYRGDTDYCLVYEDNGTGIPDGEKEIVFRQGHGKNTGLGLFLIREILDITGIGIKECGVYGEGVRFEMTIPKEGFQFDSDEQKTE